MNGVRLPAKPLSDPYRHVAQVEDGMEGAPGGVATLDIVRAGLRLCVVLPGTPGCRSRFQIVRCGLCATQADGRYVQISDRMMGLASGDDALAAAVAEVKAQRAAGQDLVPSAQQSTSQPGIRR